MLYCFIAQPCKLWKHEPLRMGFIFRNITKVKSSGNDFCLVSIRCLQKTDFELFFLPKNIFLIIIDSVIIDCLSFLVIPL